MKTINEVIKMLYIGKCCKGCIVCRKERFCWYDAVKIAKDYIEREGQI